MQDRIFVGRQRELQELEGCLDRALSGKGQVCFVTGEAGSGKTFLVQHFLEQALATDGKLVAATGTCNAQTGISDPYLPFRETLAMLTGEEAARRTAERVSPENARRLRTVVARSVQVLIEVAPDLVGLFVPGAKLVGALGKAVAVRVGWMDQLDDLAKEKAQERGAGTQVVDQTRVFEQYTALLQQISTETPLVLFLDDLQWADRASISLLFHLGRNLEGHRILLLGAYRPNDVAMGRNGERHLLEPVVNELTRYYGDVTVDLDGIPEEDSRRFVEAYLDAEPNCLEAAFREALYHQTGGHALFTVELLNTLKERGDLLKNGDGCWQEGPSLNWGAVPPRIEGVVEERLDRLDPVLQAMLAVASVEGEQFTAEVVAWVEGLSEREAIRHLSGELDNLHQLVRAQGIAEIGGLRLSPYRFEHTLFRQYLYSRLDEVERTYLHRDVGQALEDLYQEQTAVIAGQLAHHFEEAGMPDKAAAYLLQAGNRAHRMSAHQEALANLKRGSALLSDLPQETDRKRLELQLQTLLATTLVVAQGYASPHVEQAYAQARELSRELGDPPAAIPILYGLSAYQFVRAQLAGAYEQGQELLKLAQGAGLAAYELGTELVLGAAAMHMGKLNLARGHLEQVLDRYDPEQHRGAAYALGHDPAVGAWSYLSFVLWHQGFPDQAAAASQTALDRAGELNHPYSQGYAASFAAMLQQMLRQWQACQTRAEAALRIGREGGFVLWQAIGALTRGWALSQQGAAGDGIVELVQGLAAWEGTGAALALPYQRAILADAFLAAGEREKGLHALTGSFCCPQEVWWLPEQHRLRGELLLLAPHAGGPYMPGQAAAESAFRQALDLASQEGSRALQLRAAMSLARLMHDQGRDAEARAVLAEPYAWFTEGFGTPDLQEARRLLDALSEAAAGPGERRILQEEHV